MELLKLTVTYESVQSSVKQNLLAPLEILGVSEEIQLGLNKGVICLGNIDGTNSDCYGDLTVEIVNLDDLKKLKKIKLVEWNISSYIANHFNELKFYNVTTPEINKFISENSSNDEDKSGYPVLWSIEILAELLEEQYIKPLDMMKNIKVDDKDFVRALHLLAQNGIDFFY